MKLELKIGPTGVVRVKKILTDNFGYDWSIVPNSKAMVVFSSDTPPGAVLKAMAVIAADLKLRADEDRDRASSGDAYLSPGHRTRARSSPSMHPDAHDHADSRSRDNE